MNIMQVKSNQRQADGKQLHNQGDVGEYYVAAPDLAPNAFRLFEMPTKNVFSEGRKKTRILIERKSETKTR